MANTLIFTRPLAKRWGKKHRIDLPNASLADCLEIVDANHPGFVEHATGIGRLGTQYLFYSKLNKVFYETEDLQYPLDPGDTITVSPAIAGSGGKNGFIFQALGLAAIGGIIALTGGAATPLFIAAGLTLAQGVLSQMITPSDRKKKERKRSTFFQGSAQIARDRRLPNCDGAPLNSAGKIVGWQIEGLYASVITRNSPISSDED